MKKIKWKCQNKIKWLAGSTKCRKEEQFINNFVKYDDGDSDEYQFKLHSEVERQNIFYHLGQLHWWTWDYIPTAESLLLKKLIISYMRYLKRHLWALRRKYEGAQKKYYCVRSHPISVQEVPPWSQKSLIYSIESSGCCINKILNDG